MFAGWDQYTDGAGYVGRKLQHNDYWEKGREVEGVWYGRGCEQYGVERGSAVGDEFDKLAVNRHAVTGRKLCGLERENRKPFMDSTVGAPKTWSIAAGPGHCRLARDGHDYAAAKVFEEAERLIGRQAHNGREHVERTGNMAAAVFVHTSNRALEPHLHSHLVIQNLTRAANGKDYAVEYRELLDRSKYLTAVYNDALGAWAKRIGAEVTYDQYGAPQLSALLDLKPLCESRSEQIRALIKEAESIAGTQLSDREAKQIARASRGLDIEKFRQIWESEKHELSGLKGLDPLTAAADRRAFLDAFTDKVQRSAERGLYKTTSEKVAARQRDVFNEEQWERVTGFKETLSPELAPSVSYDIAPDLEYAVGHLFERRSVIKDYELCEQVLLHAQGKDVDLDQMRAAVESHPGLVVCRGEVTTLEHLRREVESLGRIQEGKGQGRKTLLSNDSPHLNAGQAAAVQSLLESPDQFTGLAGAAGVGKTSVMSVLIKANLAAGCRVAVVAPSNEARTVLRQDADKLPPGSAAADTLRDAVSLQRFQADPKLHNKLRAGDMLIVDEASFMSTAQGDQVTRWARERGVRVLFAGDPNQSPSVEAGDFFRVALQRSGIHTAELTEIVRQSPEALDGHYLAAVQHFAAGRSTHGFAELHQAGAITELQGTARVEAFADRITRAHQEGKTVVAVCPSHRECDQVNEEVRGRMLAAGRLTDERTISAHHSLGWTEEQKRQIRQLEPGQIIEFVRGDQKGQAWTVQEVRQEGKHGRMVAIVQNAAGVQTRIGREHAGTIDVCAPAPMAVAVGDTLLAYSGSIDPKGRIENGERLRVAAWSDAGNPVTDDGREVTLRNLVHAHAVTAVKSQGNTAEVNLFGIDRSSVKWATKELAYVMGSRGRHEVEVFAESVADLSQIQTHSASRRAAVEMPLEGLSADPRADVRLLSRQLQRIDERRAAPEHTHEHTHYAGRGAEVAELAHDVPERGPELAIDLQPGVSRKAPADMAQRIERAVAAVTKRDRAKDADRSAAEASRLYEASRAAEAARDYGRSQGMER